MTRDEEVVRFSLHVLTWRHRVQTEWRQNKGRFPVASLGERLWASAWKEVSTPHWDDSCWEFFTLDMDVMLTLATLFFRLINQKRDGQTLEPEEWALLHPKSLCDRFRLHCLYQSAFDQRVVRTFLGPFLFGKGPASSTQLDEAFHLWAVLGSLLEQVTHDTVAFCQDYSDVADELQRTWWFGEEEQDGRTAPTFRVLDRFNTTLETDWAGFVRHVQFTARTWIYHTHESGGQQPFALDAESLSLDQQSQRLDIILKQLGGSTEMPRPLATTPLQPVKATAVGGEKRKQVGGEPGPKGEGDTSMEQKDEPMPAAAPKLLFRAKQRQQRAQRVQTVQNKSRRLLDPRSAPVQDLEAAVQWEGSLSPSPSPSSPTVVPSLPLLLEEVKVKEEAEPSATPLRVIVVNAERVYKKRGEQGIYHILNSFSRRTDQQDTLAAQCVFVRKRFASEEEFQQALQTGPEAGVYPSVREAWRRQGKLDLCTQCRTRVGTLVTDAPFETQLPPPVLGAEFLEPPVEPQLPAPATIEPRLPAPATVPAAVEPPAQNESWTRFLARFFSRGLQWLFLTKKGRAVTFALCLILFIVYKGWYDNPFPHKLVIEKNQVPASRDPQAIDLCQRLKDPSLNPRVVADSADVTDTHLTCRYRPRTDPPGTWKQRNIWARTDVVSAAKLTQENFQALESSDVLLPGSKPQGGRPPEGVAADLWKWIEPLVRTDADGRREIRLGDFLPLLGRFCGVQETHFPEDYFHTNVQSLLRTLIRIGTGAPDDSPIALVLPDFMLLSRDYERFRRMDFLLDAEQVHTFCTFADQFEFFFNPMEIVRTVAQTTSLVTESTQQTVDLLTTHFTNLTVACSQVPLPAQGIGPLIPRAGNVTAATPTFADLTREVLPGHVEVSEFVPKQPVVVTGNPEVPLVVSGAASPRPPLFEVVRPHLLAANHWLLRGGTLLHVVRSLYDLVHVPTAVGGVPVPSAGARRRLTSVMQHVVEDEFTAYADSKAVQGHVSVSGRLGHRLARWCRRGLSRFHVGRRLVVEVEQFLLHLHDLVRASLALIPQVARLALVQWSEVGRAILDSLASMDTAFLILMGGSIVARLRGHRALSGGLSLAALLVRWLLSQAAGEGGLLAHATLVLAISRLDVAYWVRQASRLVALLLGAKEAGGEAGQRNRIAEWLHGSLPETLEETSEGGRREVIADELQQVALPVIDKWEALVHDWEQRLQNRQRVTSEYTVGYEDTRELLRTLYDWSVGWAWKRADRERPPTTVALRDLAPSLTHYLRTTLVYHEAAPERVTASSLAESAALDVLTGDSPAEREQSLVTLLQGLTTTDAIEPPSERQREMSDWSQMLLDEQRRVAPSGQWHTPLLPFLLLPQFRTKEPSESLSHLLAGYEEKDLVVPDAIHVFAISKHRLSRVPEDAPSWFVVEEEEERKRPGEWADVTASLLVGDGEQQRRLLWIAQSALVLSTGSDAPGGPLNPWHEARPRVPSTLILERLHVPDLGDATEFLSVERRLTALPGEEETASLVERYLLPGEEEEETTPRLNFAARQWVQVHPRSNLVEPLLMGTEWMQYWHTLFLSPRSFVEDDASPPQTSSEWAYRSLAENEVGVYASDAYLLQPLAVPVDITLRHETCPRFEPMLLPSHRTLLRSISSVCGAVTLADLARLAQRAHDYARQLEGKEEWDNFYDAFQRARAGRAHEDRVQKDQEWLQRFWTDFPTTPILSFRPEQLKADVESLAVPLEVQSAATQTERKLACRLDLYRWYAQVEDQGEAANWEPWVCAASVLETNLALQRLAADKNGDTMHTCWGLVHTRSSWQSLMHESLLAQRPETPTEFGRTLSLRLSPHTFHRLGANTTRLLLQASTSILYAGLTADSGPLLVLDLCCVVPHTVFLACAMVALERPVVQTWLQKQHKGQFPALERVAAHAVGHTRLSDALSPLSEWLELQWRSRLRPLSLSPPSLSPHEARYWNRLSGRVLCTSLRQLLHSLHLTPAAVLTQVLVHGS